MTIEAPPAPPCVLVIFGAAGDLTKRLLMPALYNLRRAGLLPENFAVVGRPLRGAADVNDLFDLVAVWTLEPDVFRTYRHLGFFHQTWLFTSLRSSLVFFRLNRAHLHALHVVSLTLVLLL